DGPCRAECERLVDELGIRQLVSFTGKVPRTEVLRLFRESDAFLFTSLRDTFGSVVLEAMSQGLPVLTLDHQGVGAHLPREASIKVPPASPAEVIAKLTDAIRYLCTHRDACRQMSGAAIAFAKAQSWESRARQMGAWYDKVVQKKAAETASRRPAAPA